MVFPRVLGVIAVVASSSAWGQPAGRYEVRTPSALTWAESDGGGLTGPELQLRWTGAGLRGRWGGFPVSLSARGDALVGLTGAAPTRVHVGREPDGAVLIRGQLAGAPIRLRVMEGSYEGRVGGCGYSLHPGESGSEGFRSCRMRSPEPATVVAPAPPAAAEDSLRWATAVVLVLGGPSPP